MSHASAVTPGTASNCATVPARTCHSSIAVAKPLNSVTATQPTTLSFARARHVAMIPPISPITGSAAIGKARSEEHTSELQSLMRISYAVFCLKKKTPKKQRLHSTHIHPSTNTKQHHNKQTKKK